jgi:hypothetical protein
MKENKHKLDPLKYEERIVDMLSDIEDEVYYNPDSYDYIKEGLQLILKKIADNKKLK